MGISGEIDGSVHGRISLTVSRRSSAGGRCFTLLHPVAARQRKDELGAFGRIDAGPRPDAAAGAFRLVTSVFSKNKAV